LLDYMFAQLANKLRSTLLLLVRFEMWSPLYYLLIDLPSVLAERSFQQWAGITLAC